MTHDARRRDCETDLAISISPVFLSFSRRDMVPPPPPPSAAAVLAAAALSAAVFLGPPPGLLPSALAQPAPGLGAGPPREGQRGLRGGATSRRRCGSYEGLPRARSGPHVLRRQPGVGALGLRRPGPAREGRGAVPGGPADGPGRPGRGLQTWPCSCTTARQWRRRGRRRSFWASPSEPIRGGGTPGPTWPAPWRRSGTTR